MLPFRKHRSVEALIFVMQRISNTVGTEKSILHVLSHRSTIAKLFRFPPDLSSFFANVWSRFVASLYRHSE